MSWKKWSYWLRGGMIGGGTTFAFGVLLYVCTWFTPAGGFLCLPFLFFSPLFPIAQIFDSFGFHFFPFDFLVIGIGTWFLIGAFIGAFFGYVKRKKSGTR